MRPPILPDKEEFISQDQKSLVQQRPPPGLGKLSKYSSEATGPIRGLPALFTRRPFYTPPPRQPGENETTSASAGELTIPPPPPLRHYSICPSHKPQSRHPTRTLIPGRHIISLGISATYRGDGDDGGIQMGQKWKPAPRKGPPGLGSMGRTPLAMIAEVPVVNLKGGRAETYSLQFYHGCYSQD